MIKSCFAVDVLGGLLADDQLMLIGTSLGKR